MGRIKNKNTIYTHIYFKGAVAANQKAQFVYSNLIFILHNQMHIYE